ncbi:hypothetical protein EGT07_18265 [Herbaspirillum sp. HC18]|nr:hypothetical protein EGT07_18265 [Herbaspirillum sp. HC18]
MSTRKTKTKIKNKRNEKINATDRSFSTRATWIVALLGASCFLVASFYFMVLRDVVPEYIKVANKLPITEWGWQGWGLGGILAVLAVVTWSAGSIASRCNSILQDRLFK